MNKPRIPRTKHEKGRMWATVTLIICGAFSIWANIRSGQAHADSIIVSVLPPVVAFTTSHLISYFAPRTWLTKVMIYGGFGLICLAAMYGSGWHIVETVMSTGQPVEAAGVYVLVTDLPMLLAAAILSQRVPTTSASPKVAAAPRKAAARPRPRKTTQPRAKNTVHQITDKVAI